MRCIRLTTVLRTLHINENLILSVSIYYYQTIIILPLLPCLVVQNDWAHGFLRDVTPEGISYVLFRDGWMKFTNLSTQLIKSSKEEIVTRELLVGAVQQDWLDSVPTSTERGGREGERERERVREWGREGERERVRVSESKWERERWRWGGGREKIVQQVDT